MGAPGSKYTSNSNYQLGATALPPNSKLDLVTNIIWGRATKLRKTDTPSRLRLSLKGVVVLQ